MQASLNHIEHLYMHVPFCAAKCKYCAFYSEAGNAAKMGEYVEAALLELDVVAAKLFRGDLESREKVSRLQTLSLHPKTIFFGGGTPSLLPAALMRQLLEGLQKRVPLEAIEEWTIECNPSTVSTEKAKLFREFGVNRISMGVQSLDDELLATLGRVHSRKAAVESYEKLRGAGFTNINLDLMFGLPGQTIDHFHNTLQSAIDLQPEHISTYCLILEEDTEFWSLFQQGLIKPNEEQELAMYQLAIDTLAAAGYQQYEISNFAKPGRECAHNIAYWEGKDYLGIGPSACSTIGDRRWQNVPDMEKYAVAVRNQQPELIAEERLSPELRTAESVAFGMRMNAGVPAKLVQGRWDKEIAELLSAELVQWHHNRLQPTKRGILFADEVASEFV